MGPLPIYNGRRFGCTRCGNCCRERGYVFMSLDEMQAIADYLELPLAKFKTDYDIDWDADAEQWTIDATHGRGCPLLDSQRGCIVNPVKPMQCKTFPFWEEMLDDRRTWDAAKGFCPGLDAPEGRLYSTVEIKTIRDGDLGT